MMTPRYSILHTFERVTLHEWMSCVAHMDELCDAREHMEDSNSSGWEHQGVVFVYIPLDCVLWFRHNVRSNESCHAREHIKDSTSSGWDHSGSHCVYPNILCSMIYTQCTFIRMSHVTHVNISGIRLALEQKTEVISVYIPLVCIL